MYQNTQLIVQLNRVLNLQLMAIDQFYLHARLYKKWGLSALGQMTREKSQQLLAQVDNLMLLIEQLDGCAETSNNDNLPIGFSVPQCIELDRRIEIECRNSCLRALTLCNEKFHRSSIDLLNEFLEQSEQHSEWLDQELNAIHTQGIQAFIKNEMSLDSYWKLAVN